MERRLEFGRGDVQFLANLCHDCGACLHACQYAPPHEFAVNVPAAMAAVRSTTYEAHAWPAAFGALYRRQGAWVAAALAGGLALFFLLGLARNGTLAGAAARRGSFYSVFPHGLMVTIFGLASLWIVLAFAIGVVRFWRGLACAQRSGVDGTRPTADAAGAALTLRYLDGGGDGCNVER